MVDKKKTFFNEKNKRGLEKIKKIERPVNEAQTLNMANQVQCMEIWQNDLCCVMDYGGLLQRLSNEKVF